MTQDGTEDRFVKLFPKINDWDKSTFKKIYFKFSDPYYKILSKILSFTADPRLWALWIAIFGIYGLITENFSFAIIFFFGFMQTFITYQLTKKAIKRPRPFIQLANIERHDKTGHGYSFPSGHVHHSGIFVILLVLVFLPKIWMLIPLFIYHFLIALSRMINGCHFPSDTIFATFEIYLEIAIFWFFTKDLYLQLFNIIWNFIF